MNPWANGLSRCQLGSRYLFRELLQLFPSGIVPITDDQMHQHFGVCIRTVREHVGDLRRHGLLRRGKAGYYIPIILAQIKKKEL